jgi:hypothetical protein
LFQRRHETEGIDSAVVICLDVSGSMFTEGGFKLGYAHADRIVHAVLTARALIETLQKSQVATCVLTFGTRTAVFKPFNVNPTKAIPLFNAIDDGGSTNDYFCLRFRQFRDLVHIHQFASFFRQISLTTPTYLRLHFHNMIRLRYQLAFIFHVKSGGPCRCRLRSFDRLTFWSREGGCDEFFEFVGGFLFFPVFRLFTWLSGELYLSLLVFACGLR